MSINCTDRESLEEFLKKNLKENRYRHSLGVQEMAERLAGIHGADIEKASFAGRYHDLAKNFDQERMNDCVRKYGLPDELIDDCALAHSKVAAAILEKEFGVDDEDILNSIRYHTTARSGMSLLEELIYVADVVEDGRTYSDLAHYQQLAYDDLDRCCLEILEYTFDYLKDKGRDIHRDTLEAYVFIRDRVSIKGVNMGSKEIAKTIADLLSSKKAREVVMIDIAEKSSFADYFINATAGNERQLGALADDVEEKLAEFGIEPKSKDGRPETGWILVDGGDVIVNIFTEETRQKYTLERIWNDCEMILVD